jgi:hypothetical protein
MGRTAAAAGIGTTGSGAGEFFFAVHDNLRWHGVVLVMGQVNGSSPIGLRNDFPKIET